PRANREGFLGRLGMTEPRVKLQKSKRFEIWLLTFDFTKGFLHFGRNDGARELPRRLALLAPVILDIISSKLSS
ncbi:MAG: hypothetical protein ABIK39_01795, partial [candidate division WOR-3 bacterium]